MADLDAKMVPERGALCLSEPLWEEAKRRAAVIVPLMEQKTVAVALAAEAADALGVSTRTVYALIRRYRESGGLLSAFAPVRSQGGRGGTRLPEAVERIVAAAITELYLSRQKLVIESVVAEIHRRCRTAGVRSPTANTVRARIRRLRPEIVTRCRDGADAARRLQAVVGHFPETTSPLEVIQIDHTLVDLIVVDPFCRQPIGRPWLTVAIDVFSRCIIGVCLTLEPPSAVSVGLCLAHAALDKRPWLERLGITAAWPMHGKPRVIYVDNGTEFHSEALQRGCELHGIRIAYRPIGEPHYGGIVERVIGTLMHMIHGLPGTTFSGIIERGDYDADGMAALTLAELERWLALAITGPYHGSVHSGLGEPPAARWQRSIDTIGAPMPIRDPKAFLIDFLPVLRRRIQRQGLVIDHIAYFGNSLRPWIAERDRGHRFLIRRDPRDLSRIWVLPPNEAHYLEIPYRNLARPAVTLWEHRQAVARLRKEGRERVDEEAIFRAITAMRTIMERAIATTRTARRRQARTAHLRPSPSCAEAPLCVPDISNEGVASAAPFADIEEW
jgi:putative transposase